MDKQKIKGLRSPGSLGRKPIIGLILFLIGSLIFIILAYNLITNGPLIRWDLPIANYFHALALKSSPLVIGIMIAGYYLGKEGIIFIGILLALYFIYKKFWRELIMGGATLGLGSLSFILLSNIFNRPRPFHLFKEQIWPGSPNIPGFPSGHTLSIMILSCFLLYLLLPKIKTQSGKFLAIFITLLIIIFIGFSRLYVGDHYLTDIIAGYAFGIAWFGFSGTLVEWLFQRHSPVKKNE